MGRSFLKNIGSRTASIPCTRENYLDLLESQREKNILGTQKRASCLKKKQNAADKQLFFVDNSHSAHQFLDSNQKQTAMNIRGTLRSKKQKDDSNFPMPRIVRNAKNFLMPRSVRNAKNFLMPRSVRNANNFLMPRFVRNANNFLMPRSVRNANNFLMPRSIRNANNFLMPRSGRNANNFLMPRSIRNANNFLMPRSGRNANNFLMPRSIRNANNFLMPRSGRNANNFPMPRFVKKDTILKKRQMISVMGYNSSTYHLLSLGKEFTCYTLNTESSLGEMKTAPNFVVVYHSNRRNERDVFHEFSNRNMLSMFKNVSQLLMTLETSTNLPEEKRVLHCIPRAKVYTINKDMDNSKRTAVLRTSDSNSSGNMAKSFLKVACSGLNGKPGYFPYFIIPRNVVFSQRNATPIGNDDDKLLDMKVGYSLGDMIKNEQGCFIEESDTDYLAFPRMGRSNEEEQKPELKVECCPKSIRSQWVILGKSKAITKCIFETECCDLDEELLVQSSEHLTFIRCVPKSRTLSDADDELDM